MADFKPCPNCGGELHYETKPGTRDVTLGPSLYCNNCLYREWGQRPTRVPNPDEVKDEHQEPDWKLDEYERRGNQPEIAQITGQIGLGDLMDAWILRDRGSAKPFDAILNVCQKTYTPPPDVEYANIPLTEYGSKAGKRRKRDAEFERAVNQLSQWVDAGKRVFVHCVAGANRSASVIMAYLMQHGLDFPHALNFVREKRPVAWPHGEIFLTLQRFGEGHKSARRSAAKEDVGQFVAEVDWHEPFDNNYMRIEEGTKDIAKYDRGAEFYESQHSAAERFIRADILMNEALGQQHYYAQQFPEAPPKGRKVDVMAAKKKEKPDKDPFSKPMFPSGRPEILPFEMNPREDIKRVDPDTAYRQVLSRRGLKIPNPEVFNSERYQAVYQRAPLIPLDPKDPTSIDRAIEFVQTTRGLFIESNLEEAPQEYFRVPTKYGNRKTDHVMYASWFAMFSPNTAVESEETSFVLWQAGQAGKDPGQPGIMCKKDKILYWLGFLKWAGFPNFNNLWKTVEKFDPSDESYERRMMALARLPGIQFKVGSFMLALLGDTRSPTLDMHALGYLMQTGKLEIPQGMEWSNLAELAQEANELEAMWAQIQENPNNWDLKAKYQERKQTYDRRAEENKKIIGKLTAQMRVQKGDKLPKTQRGQESEKRKVREYIRRQMEGWDGKTDTFWGWYAKNEYFKTHEPRRSMIHTVFFQSLFPELFTPEALQQRQMVQEMGDPETRTEEQEDRAKYRDYLENLLEMRKIQQPKTKQPKPVKPAAPKKTKEKPIAPPPSDDDFDWGSGEFGS